MEHPVCYESAVDEFFAEKTGKTDRRVPIEKDEKSGADMYTAISQEYLSSSGKDEASWVIF